jgi:agmatinase
MLGGEHSITFAAVQSFIDMGEDFGVLYLDAHGDLRNEYEGSVYNHACVMRRVSESIPVVGVGIRSLSQEEADYIKSKEISIFTPQDIKETQDWITEVINVLPEKVYISLDVDVLDPAFMPATGTPEPEGLSYYEVRKLLKEVVREREVIGFDVVELSPRENLHHCEFSMAKLIYQFLTYRHVYKS